MRTELFLCVSVFRVASGPRVKLASCKSALTRPPPPPPPPPVVCSTDRSKAVVPVLVLLFVALYSTRRFVVCLSVCQEEAAHECSFQKVREVVSKDVLKTKMY